MVNIPERCNNTKELNGLVAVMLELALEDIKSQGVIPLVVETYRIQQRQNYLYCQGRSIIEVTSLGINNTFAKAYSNPKAGKVTWTLNSVHTSRKAVDVVPQRLINSKMTAIWNTYDPQMQIIIKIMQKYGFEAGANWSSNPDSPHFQVKGDFTSVFDKDHTNVYVTKAIQNALNKTNNNKLKVDGKWGPLTTYAINEFRKSQRYKTARGQLGTKALKTLLSKLN